MRRSKADSRPRSSARWLLATIVVVGILGTGAASVYFGSGASRVRRPASTEASQDDLTLVFSATAEYPRNARPNFAGPQVCAECHKTIHDGYQQTKHPHTCRPVVADKMPSSFSGNDRFQSVHSEVSFEMTRDASSFYQTSFQSGPNGPRALRTRIDLVLGAGGTADDVFLSWRDDGQLRELPMAWLYPSKEWAASHFDPLAGEDFSRAMTVRCVECHNTWVEHVVGTANQYRREGALLGVTCESCHGPAGQHVEFHRLHPDHKVGQHIVAPAKLPRQRRIEVCTQCHSNAMRHRTSAFAYRPGQPLDEYYKTISTSATEDDRVANQITYLQRSQCFIRDERMTCVTCHNPHQPNTAENSGSSSCSKCHQPHDCRDADNLPAEVRGSCVSCHMPSYLKINVNFQTARDNFVPPIRRTEHRIAVHPHARDETLLEYHRRQSTEESKQVSGRLAARLAAHFLAEADRCRQQYRFLGEISAMREAVRFDPSAENQERLRQVVGRQTDLDLKFVSAMKLLGSNDARAGIAAFESILAVNPNDAKAHGRLGMEYAKIGDRQRANVHLEAVGKCDPNDVYGVAMLAWLAFLDGKFEESLRLYSLAEEIEPREAKMKYQIGLVLAKSSRPADAIVKFKAALEIEPWHAEATQAIVAILLETHRAVEAITYAERAAQATNSQNAHVLAMLADVYAAAGQPEKAIKAFRLAMRRALLQDPSIIPGLQQAIDKLTHASAVPASTR